MQDYQFISSGNKRKIEKFGKFIIERPAYQAVWKNSSNNAIDLKYDKKNKWQILNQEFPEKLILNIYDKIKVELKKSGKGQIGIFPEQFQNWLWINELAKSSKRKIKILNCFAYTGAATLFSVLNNDNVEICHLDGSKTFVKWASKNAKLSGLENKNIRWMIEDVMTFLKKEKKRGNKYDAFILDPPAFGRGPKGKIWKLSKDLKKMLNLIKDISSTDPLFYLLSLHDPEFSTGDLEKIFRTRLQLSKKNIQSGKMNLISENGKNKLTTGNFVRWCSKII